MQNYLVEGTMGKEVINTKKAPAAIGPYSQAIKAGGLLFISGQLGIDPTSGKMIANDIRDETRLVLENIKAILKVSGSSLDKVVKTTVFVSDMNNFVKMNEIYGQYFNERPPARATVEVSRLPKDAKVEIDAIAICE